MDASMAVTYQKYPFPPHWWIVRGTDGRETVFFKLCFTKWGAERVWKRVTSS